MPQPIDLPTRVLVAEGEAQIRSLCSEYTQERRDAMNAIGLDTAALAATLEAAIDALKQAKAMQEMAKVDLRVEHIQDRNLAEQGYRFKLATDARIRAYLLLHPEHEEMRPAFRIRKLRGPRPQPVLSELHNTLAELANHQERLVEVGIDDDYLRAGHKLVELLHRNKEETHQALVDQKAATAHLRDLEQTVSDVFRKLTAFDKAVVAEAPDVERMFNLYIIKTEIRRVRALNEASKKRILLEETSS
ncbi:MAG: hypothetical protein GY822_30050 [Deltaproteobacteria bacterium]|nr:hypothetical protein [Deltaproteobacteria bacterium]